jgi:DNA-directed RNA polymerase subunit RPC12/RpoP
MALSLDSPPVMSSPESFIDATDQAGKLHGGIACFVLLGLVTGFLMFYAELTDAVMLMTIATVVATLAVGTWLCLSIRCPRCHTKIVLVAVRQQSIDRWYQWLTTLAACPKCSFRP